MIGTKPGIPRNRISLRIVIQSVIQKQDDGFNSKILFFSFFFLAPNKFPLPFYIAKYNIIHVYCSQRFFFSNNFVKILFVLEHEKKRKILNSTFYDFYNFVYNSKQFLKEIIFFSKFFSSTLILFTFIFS